MTVTLTRTGNPVTHDQQPKPSPAWQGLRPTGKTLDNGQPEPGKPIIINCQQSNPENCHDHGIVPAVCPGLCAACTQDFRLVLSDVPLLLDDLDIAIAGETRFVEHGTRNGTNTATASSGVNQAIAAHQRLAAAIMKAAGWFDTQQPELIARGLLIHLNQLSSLPPTRTIALDISSAVSRTHKVIDAPPDMTFYGACPNCGTDIWQTRIGPHTKDQTITCRCGYTADLTDHQHALLAAGDDRLLTETELVAAIGVTREQIRRWRDKGGLPRETRIVAHWADKQLIAREVDVFRLGDARAYADSEKLDGTITSREAAKRLVVAEDTIRKLVERHQLEPIRRAAKPLRFRLEEIYRYQQARLA